ncbi:MAG: ABC transporter permease [Promethearchaeota archaeon]
MFRYAIKRVARSYKLFIALTISVLVASSFFASTNVAADLLARDALDASIDGVVYDFIINDRQGSNWTEETFENIEAQLDSISEVVGHSRTSWVSLNYNNTGTDFNVIGVEWDSDMTTGMTLQAGRSSLGPNETYVLGGSRNESLFQIDDVVTVPITILASNGSFFRIEWNLTVAGVVSVPEEQRYAMLQNPTPGILRGAFGISLESRYNILLVDWNSTSRVMLDSFEYPDAGSVAGVLNSIHLKLDRERIIDPYNIEASIERVQDVRAIVLERVQPYGGTVESTLELPLMLYMVTSLLMNLQFIGLSLPIFFMAYFTGTMVSDVSFNLRRREIGLLLTKGYRRRTIRNMFLFEGVLVGAISGAASIFLGATVAYFTVQTRLDYFTVLSGNVTSIILSIMLGMILALISVWRPANRAAKLETLDALRQYVYVEETSEYKRLLPTITFTLGTYKLIVWILGINVNELITSLSLGNLFLAIAAVAWIAVDNILNYLGPLFFLYGATKIFMRGSLRFQEAIVSGGQRIFGAFGRLATRNIKRNPARNAALVFIVALIVSYGVFTIGNLYTQFDQVERNAKYNVGADLRLELEPGANLTDIISNVTGHDLVESATTEYRLTMLAGDYRLDARGITPEEWIETAYWEPEWFLGDIGEMIDSLGNNEIILSVETAKDLNLEVGDSVSVGVPLSQEVQPLQIIGLIGFQSVLAEFIEDFGASFAGSYPSFVSEQFLNDSNYKIYSTANILIDTANSVNGTTLQAEFGETLSGLAQTYSVTSELKDYYERPIQRGPLLIQGVAIVFAIILGMVGTGIVIILTLREKEAEIALFSVRGFTKWQLFKTLFAEMMVMVFFSLLLGYVVGIIQIFGNVSLINSSATGLIRSRVILAGMAGYWMLAIIGVVVLSAAIPVYMTSRRPEAKVEVLRK